MDRCQCFGSSDGGYFFIKSELPTFISASSLPSRNQIRMYVHTSIPSISKSFVYFITTAIFSNLSLFDNRSLLGSDARQNIQSTRITLTCLDSVDLEDGRGGRGDGQAGPTVTTTTSAKPIFSTQISAHSWIIDTSSMSDRGWLACCSTLETYSSAQATLRNLEIFKAWLI